MGSFSMKGWSYVKAGIPFFIIGILGVSFYFKEMDVLTFGEDQAKTIGVDTNKVKRRLFLYKIADSAFFLWIHLFAVF